MFTKNRGFTFIEISIVLVIIATFVTFSSPVMKGYIDRAKDVRYSEIIKKQVQFIQQYREMNGGALEYPPYPYPPFSIHCIPGTSDRYCQCNTVDDGCDPPEYYTHTGLTQFMQGLPEWNSIKTEISQMPFWEGYQDNSYIWVNRAPVSVLNSIGWEFIIPGYNPTDNSSVDFMYWWLPGTSGWPIDTNIRINNESLGKLPDNRCRPGLAVRIGYGNTMCMYIFPGKQQ